MTAYDIDGKLMQTQRGRELLTRLHASKDSANAVEIIGGILAVLLTCLMICIGWFAWKATAWFTGQLCRGFA